jgi:hypothetical protein
MVCGMTFGIRPVRLSSLEAGTLGCNPRLPHFACGIQPKFAIMSAVEFRQEIAVFPLSRFLQCERESHGKAKGESRKPFVMVICISSRLSISA